MTLKSLCLWLDYILLCPSLRHYCAIPNDLQIIYRAKILKTVTFDPLGLQKWQSTKNDSTLHQKSIHTISKMIYTLFCQQLPVEGNVQPSIQWCLYKNLVFWLSGCRPQCNVIHSEKFQGGGGVWWHCKFSLKLQVQVSIRDMKQTQR